MIGIVEGDTAAAQLRHDSFRREWRELHALCPWATVYQSPAFSDVWWAVYAERFEPLFVEERDDSGALCGLLLLARERDTHTPPVQPRESREHRPRTLVHVGTHHAEYHTWLSAAAHGDAFMNAALATLSRARAGSRLRLHFLAPGSPRGWTERRTWPQSPICLVSTHDWGVRELGGGALDAASLRKRSNRSKLNRLARDGAVNYRRVSSREEFERWLPQIIAQNNARHGSATQPGPFDADPDKAKFYARLMQAPGLAHCGVLVRGETLLASHTGCIDGPALGLGLLTHHAEAEEHSPGTLLLHMVGQDVSSMEITTFDLTPGGLYKQRLATRRQRAYAIDIRFRRTDALLALLTRRARRAARALLNWRGALELKRKGED